MEELGDQRKVVIVMEQLGNTVEGRGEGAVALPPHTHTN
jgi:hypothetical protein